MAGLSSLFERFHSGGVFGKQTTGEQSIPVVFGRNRVPGKISVPHTSITGKSLGTVYVDEFEFEDVLVPVYLGNEFFGTLSFRQHQAADLKTCRLGETWSHSVLVERDDFDHVTYQVVETEVGERRVRIDWRDWEDSQRRIDSIERYKIPSYFEVYQNHDSFEAIVKWKALQVKNEDDAAILFDSEFFEP